MEKSEISNQIRDAVANLNSLIAVAKTLGLDVYIQYPLLLADPKSKKVTVKIAETLEY